MSSLLEQPCYVYIARPPDFELQPNDKQVRDSLEKGSIKAKIETLKKLILSMLHGERVSSSLLMCVIRFCLPSQDHMMKRLLLIFWEIVPKRSSDGKLLQEMILVCDAYRKDLQHPNEFVRGSTLRFLCRLKEPELIEPLLPSIRACLEYRHAYVRRNAVLAAFTIYRSFDFLIPDAPELVYNFLETEQDASCKRNAFMMLLHADRRLALDYLSTCLDQVINFSNILQLIVVQLIYTVCLSSPNETRRFLRCVYNLLHSSSSAVRYEASSALISLTSAPAALKAALSAMVDLITKESDNNVKLIVLDRLTELRKNASVSKVLQELVMDILRVLHCPDLEVQKKTLSLAYDLVTMRNVDDVVQCLRKEVANRTVVASASKEDNQKYRQLLVKTMHNICVKYSDVAGSLVPALIDLLSDAEEAAAAEILTFVREAVPSMPSLRPVVVRQLLQLAGSIQNATTLRHALWILGEHCQAGKEIEQLVAFVTEAVGPLPFDQEAQEEEEETGQRSVDVAKKLNPDGTYATHTAFTTVSTVRKKCVLRTLLLGADYFFFVCLASILTKAAIRYANLKTGPGDRADVNKLSAEVMFILASVLQVGQKGVEKGKMSTGEAERIKLCIKLLAKQNEQRIKSDLVAKCRQSLENMLRIEQEERKEKATSSACATSMIKPGERIVFSLLEKDADATGQENVFDASLSQALGESKKSKDDQTLSSRLDSVIQLSGYSDPVYVEAVVELNSYDITLDCLLVNQTTDTLEGVTLELATLGDLKLVEKPLPITLAGQDFATMKTSIKVSSTENGVIFGTLSYDVRGSTGDRNCIYLNDIHIDIINYILPTFCTDDEFRQMWSEFEWENKVAVATTLSSLKDYLSYLIKQTNMRCLTPEEVLSGDSGFLAANLYARSIFGEDALANLSIEKASNDPSAAIVGHIRIRAKSQGMALSMGDRISKVQKAHSLANQNLDMPTIAV